MGRKPREKTLEELQKEASEAEAAYQKLLGEAEQKRAAAKELYSKKRTHLLLLLGGMVLARARKDPALRAQLSKIATEEEMDAKGDKAKADRADLQALVAATANPAEQ